MRLLENHICREASITDIVSWYIECHLVMLCSLSSNTIAVKITELGSRFLSQIGGHCLIKC